MQQSNLESFLNTSTILAVLSIDENWEKESLNKSASCVEIFLFRRTTILFWILNGPLALLVLREDMMLAISSLSVDWII